MTAVAAVNAYVRHGAQEKVTVIARNVSDAWFARDNASAFAYPRALGAPGKRHRQHKVLPVVKLPDDSLAQNRS